MIRGATAAILILAALPLAAEVLDRSPRPPINPRLAAVETAELQPAAPQEVPVAPAAALASTVPPPSPFALTEIAPIPLPQALVAPPALRDPQGGAAAAEAGTGPVAGASLVTAAPAPMMPAAPPAALVASTPAPVAAPPATEAAPLTETESPGIRPRARPDAILRRAEEARAAAEVPVARSSMSSSPRPRARPAKLSAPPATARVASAARPEPAPVAAAPAPKSSSAKRDAATPKGSVCGVAAIKGEKIAPIPGKVQGCGLADGVRVTSVSGVRLSTPATIDCATAKALNTWVEGALQPAYRGKVVELKVAAHYICRPRNNKKGAKISEHGRGKAIDIAGFTFADGRTVSVLKNYDATMRSVHRKACGTFGTTLGPGSDGFHEDHLHFDTAAYRKGAYCR